MDDITPQMDWAKFDAFRQLFEKYEIKPLIGVVPDNRDPALCRNPKNPHFWDTIRNLVNVEGWSLAQHGYQHLYETTNGGILGIQRSSEFAGLSSDVQREKVESGQAKLGDQGLTTDIWMAPSHSFDAVTLRVLEDLGFRYVSDGYSLFPYMVGDLKFIPCQASMLRIHPPFGLVTFCIHSNDVGPSQFRKYCDLFENMKDSLVDFSHAMAVAVGPKCDRMIECVAIRVRMLRRVVRALQRHKGESARIRQE